MSFMGRGVIWRIAAPTLALSVVLLTTVAVAAVALHRVQIEADGAIDQALSAAEATEHFEHELHEVPRPSQRLCDDGTTSRSRPGRAGSAKKAVIISSRSTVCRSRNEGTC
jgi:hypothetical protein